MQCRAFRKSRCFKKVFMCAFISSRFQNAHLGRFIYQYIFKIYKNPWFDLKFLC
jgi:hypothetical protein